MLVYLILLKDCHTSGGQAPVPVGQRWLGLGRRDIAQWLSQWNWRLVWTHLSAVVPCHIIYPDTIYCFILFKQTGIFYVFYIFFQARDRFGYYVSPQDPKFKKLREEIEARQKQMRKEKRKKNQSESWWLTYICIVSHTFWSTSSEFHIISSTTKFAVTGGVRQLEFNLFLLYKNDLQSPKV